MYRLVVEYGDLTNPATDKYFVVLDVTETGDFCKLICLLDGATRIEAKLIVRALNENRQRKGD